MYSGNSQWFIEATAQWYMARKNLQDADMYVEASCICENPHLALWHTLENGDPSDPRDWLFMCRLYALNTWLVYLTEVKQGRAVLRFILLPINHRARVYT